MEKAIRQYDIHFVGLKTGLHNFSFEVSNTFFRIFENEIVKNGQLEIELQFDKQISHFVLQFSISGWVEADCDRCTNSLQYPIKNSFTMYVKFEDERVNDEVENDEVLYISRTESTLNIAQLLYEYIILSLPIVKNCDFLEARFKNCNQEILDKLNETPGLTNDEGVDERWQGLKNIKLDN
jgi:uncharacterized protein